MIRIVLERNPVVLGGKVAGDVSWTAPKDAHPRKIRAALRWHTEGRGSTADDTIATCDYNCGPVAASETAGFRFEFDLPRDVPVSFNGKLIRMIWSVDVYVDLPWAFDPKASAEFDVVAPEAPA